MHTPCCGLRSCCSPLPPPTVWFWRACVFSASAIHRLRWPCLHGLLAGAGLTLLLFAAFTAGLPTLALWGLVLLVLAACGGLVMNLHYAWNRNLIPPPLMYGHAVIAVAGFILLVVDALGGTPRP